MIPVYDEKRSDSILKKRYEVRKNDMNILVNEHILFEYAGYFISSGEWIHPDKTEQTYEIIFVTQGTVFLCDEKQGPIEIRAGQVCLLEPGVRHYGTEISEGVRFYWVHFHLKQGCLPFEQRFFEAFEQKQLFRELLHLCNLMPQPDYAVNAVLNYILSELCRIAENEGKYDRRAEEIYEWMRINASARLRAEHVADHFGFSKDHLSRILQQSYGCGMKKLMARFLMDQARGMLCNTQLYVKEIADALQFPSDKDFIGFFKYYEGISPEQFRNRISKIHMNNQ